MHDNQGMTRKELLEIGVRLYGVYGWPAKMARDLGVHGSTVRRWAEGRTMPPMADKAVLYLASKDNRRRGRNKPSRC